MNKILLVKKITTWVVAAGAAKIVYAIIDNNTGPEKTSDKIAIRLSSLAAGAMAAEALGSYTDAKIDSAIASVDALFRPSNRTDSI